MRKSVEIQNTQYMIEALCSSNRSNRSSRNGTPKITQPNPTWLLYQTSQTLERILGPSSIGRTRGQINLPDRCNIREDEFRGGRGFHGFRSVTSPICLASRSSYALRESFSRSDEFLSVSLSFSLDAAQFISSRKSARDISLPVRRIVSIEAIAGPRRLNISRRHARLSRENRRVASRRRADLIAFHLLLSHN